MDFSTLRLTRQAFLWTYILRAPFWAIYTLLVIILYKDLHASPFQIALFIALKPIVSIFSLYWSAYINKRPDRLVSNVVWGGILGALPFLLFPFYCNAWLVLFASALYMMTHRGVVPAWMEIFKLNLPDGVKQKVFSYGSIVSYVIGAVLPVIIGPLLDTYPLCWRWMFSFCALLGMGAIFFQLRIPLPKLPPPVIAPVDLRKHILDPWKNAWNVLSRRKDFRAYEIGFMFLGGCGLMIIQPALPHFFIDRLGLSYTELSIALSLCKGVGFALTSPVWARRMATTDLFRFSSVVVFLGGIFPLMLLGGQFHVAWIYAAYLLYGVLQAGSELSWHLSGPLFAKEEDSTQYSQINVLIVGLRGCVIPQIGSILCLLAASGSVLTVGALCCFLGMGWLLLSRKKVIKTVQSF